MADKPNILDSVCDLLENELGVARAIVDDAANALQAHVKAARRVAVRARAAQTSLQALATKIVEKEDEVADRLDAVLKRTAAALRDQSPR